MKNITLFKVDYLKMFMINPRATTATKGFTN